MFENGTAEIPSFATVQISFFVLLLSSLRLIPSAVHFEVNEWLESPKNIQIWLIVKSELIPEKLLTLRATSRTRNISRPASRHNLL